MDLRKRLFRRPVQTILWQIILIAMALLIGVGGALTYSSAKLTDVLDEHHTTIAVHQKQVKQTGETSWAVINYSLTEQDIQTLRGLDMVKNVDLRTLTGAYCPQLTAQIGLMDWKNVKTRKSYHQMEVDNFREWSANDSYDKVILAGTVEQAWTCYDDYVSYTYDLSDFGGPAEAVACNHRALIRIDKILSAHPDYEFFPSDAYTEYTGKVIVDITSISAPSDDVYATGEETFFEVGEQYIVQGNYDPACHTRDGDYPGVPLSPRLAASTVLMEAYGALEKGESLVGYKEYLTESNMSIMDVSPENHGVEKGIKVSDDVVPVATKLNAPLEDFLADPDNSAWAQLIEEYEMTLHSLPVLGTEALESMYVFLKNEASIVDGRMFTQEEYDSGAKVCIISESVAVEAGISAGDTITLSQFLCGNGYTSRNYSVEDRANEVSLNNPALGWFAFPHGLPEQEEQFTVAGIYRLENEWENSAFSITPNTVFMPQKTQLAGGFGGPSYAGQVSIGAREEYENGKYIRVPVVTKDLINNGVVGVYLSVILENGRMDDFMEALQETGLASRVFLTFDQGYAAAQESVQAVIDAAEKLFLVAAAGWILLLILYVLLYQSKERQNLGIMRSVGAGTVQTRRYLFGSGLLPAAAGILIGTALSGVVTKLVQEKLIGLTLTQARFNAHSGGMELDNSQLAGMLAQSKVPVEGLLTMALVQIIAVAVLLWCHAALLARKKPRKLLGV